MAESRRDTILNAIKKEGPTDFMGIMRGIRAESRESSDSKSMQGLVDEYKNDCSDELRDRMDGVMRRDKLGPHEGETPPDFNLKRLGSDDRVKLSNFKGQRPVALVFGSYT